MKTFRIGHFLAGWLMRMALAVLFLQPDVGRAAIEETFPVLQIGTKTYKNVTVTTKAKSYIFILHSTGMTNIKLAELSPELRQKLGYVEQPKPATKNPAAWAKNELAKIDLSQLKQLEQRFGRPGMAGASIAAAITPERLIAGLVGVLLFYLFFCHCCRLICQKTGNPPGALIWMPVFQLIPMLRAAGMSPWWFLAYFVPVLNIIAVVLWSWRIVEARVKSGWVAVFLLLPVTTFFAVLYLAFSSATPRKEKRVLEIMTLDAA